MLLMLVAVIALAVVGLLVSVVLGAVILQRIVQRHIHIIQKKSLVSQYVVADLENDNVWGGRELSEVEGGPGL